jgi:hypothetical protein
VGVVIVYGLLILFHLPLTLPKHVLTAYVLAERKEGGDDGAAADATSLQMCQCNRIGLQMDLLHRRAVN